MMGVNWGNTTSNNSNATAANVTSPWTQEQQVQQQQQTQQWSGQQYGSSIMAPPITPAVSATQHQFNQFTSNFSVGASNPTYDSFRNQRSLPSPNLNHYS